MGEKRTPTLVQLIGVHLARGDNRQTIEALVRGWASKCSPELKEEEWRPHLEKLVAKDEGKRMTPFFNHTTSIREITAEEEEEVITHPLRTSSSSSAEVGNEEVLSSPTVGRCAADRFDPSTSSSSSARVGDEKNDEVKMVSSDNPFPRLPQAAYYGLLGEMLKAVEPETEADTGAILLGWLTIAGNIVGRGAWVQVGATIHHPALYVAIVGKSSVAKGDAWAVANYPFAEIEPDWHKNCVCPGVGSGEGLLERIADEQRTMVLNKKSGLAEEQVVAGAADKRCLLRLSELSRLFKSQRRESNPLSEILREGWDGSPISIPNRKRKGERDNNSLSSTHYAISAIGDITPGVIKKTLETGTEGYDGFANRFLWAAVRADKELPDGGNVSVLKPFLSRLQEILTWAKDAGELKRDDEANGLWKEIYRELKYSGDCVPHTDRARPQVVRLSLIFALLDKSPEIKKSHLEAALAVWDYCKQSARYCFGTLDDEGGAVEAEPLWLEILNLLPPDGAAVERWRLNERFKRKAAAEQVGEVLRKLEAGNHVKKVLEATGGRMGERWRKVIPDDTLLSSSSSSDTVGGEEEEELESMNLGDARTAVEDKSSSFPNSGGEEEEEEEGLNRTAVEAPSSSSSPSFSATSSGGETSSSSSAVHEQKLEEVKMVSSENTASDEAEDRTPKPETQEQWAKRLRAQIRAERGLL